ncbi:unnamed protein product, partial [Polarella glacialis]
AKLDDPGIGATDSAPQDTHETGSAASPTNTTTTNNKNENSENSENNHNNNNNSNSSSITSPTNTTQSGNADDSNSTCHRETDSSTAINSNNNNSHNNSNNNNNINDNNSQTGTADGGSTADDSAWHAKCTQGQSPAADEAEPDAPPPRSRAWMEANDGSKLLVDGLDFYGLLGVSQDAGPEDLRRGYREQALLWHPDKAGPQATERFQALSEAHEALADGIMCAAYDAMLSHFPPPRPTAAELHPTGFKEVEMFRATPADLRSLAKFSHDRRTCTPIAICDVAWQRTPQDLSRVRLVFCGGYAPSTSDEAMDFRSPPERGRVYDSVATHLALLLRATGCEPQESDSGSPADAEAERCASASATELPKERVIA